VSGSAKSAKVFRRAPTLSCTVVEDKVRAAALRGMYSCRQKPSIALVLDDGAEQRGTPKPWRLGEPATLLMMVLRSWLRSRRTGRAGGRSAADAVIRREQRARGRFSDCCYSLVSS